MMAKLKFLAPRESPAQITLLTQATQAGFKELAVRNLLWLINAHPLLSGHARIFLNLSAFFASPTFSSSVIAWANGWTRHIPEWIKFCDWCWLNRHSLSSHLDLAEFDLQPKTSKNHPLINRGIERHGIPGALWNTHEDVNNYPPSQAAQNGAGNRYFSLQSHLLAGYMECRFRLSTLEFFESYSGERELPVAPIRSSSISPSIRELSHQKYSPVLEQFPLLASTEEFATVFDRAAISLTALGIGDRQRARVAINAVHDFFKRFSKVLNGWHPNQTPRQGWGGGGKARRPGFIQLPIAPGVYITKPSPPPSDTDFPHDEGMHIYVGKDEDHDNDPVSLEESGLSPYETLEEAISLYPAEMLKVKALKLHRQRLALEMQAQNLPFSYTTLTAQEILSIWQIATDAIEQHVRTRLPDQESRHRAYAALAIKLSLAYGQPLERVATLRTIQRGSLDQTEFQNSPDLFLPAVVICADENGLPSTRMDGIALPAIQPDYRTTLDQSLEEIDRPATPFFLLPDLFDIGPDLIAILGRDTKKRTHVFDTHGAVLKKHVQKLLGEHGDKRITPEKICRVLSDRIASLQKDSCLAWITTSDTSQASQSRMHYSRYGIDQIHRAYHRAARHLGRAIGYRVSAIYSPRCGLTGPTDTVGARFVITLESVRNLLTSLKEVLRGSHQDVSKVDDFVRYHNLYVLYTLLYQSLDSSMRAVRMPTQLYEAWKRQSNQTPCLASLQDKDSTAADKARLATISDGLSTHFGHYKNHEAVIGHRKEFFLDFHLSPYRPFFGLTTEFTLEAATPKWITQQLENFYCYAIPANFHRAFLRTELIERGCTAEVIDAFLGHFNYGEGSFGMFSTFDYGSYGKAIGKFLAQIHQDIGLEPIESIVTSGNEN